MAYQNGKTYYVIPLCATGDAAYNQKILNKQVQPLALNIQGTGDHYNNRNVNVYSLDWSTDMQWYLEVPRDAGYARFHCKGNPEYGLDYYYGSSNPGNCDIYKIIGNEEDSKINFRTINASENLYRIQCYRNNADNDLYLTATGTSNGADVRWQPLDSSKAAYQTWWLVPIENVSANTPSTPAVPTTPNEIKDQEFFVKAYGTNLYLNVHGTDTVANSRNVTVYAKENCLAQKWIARQTTAGPKLFTSINQAYALNINTTDNNCTMHTASGNDTDSVLAFEEVADMLYRIKMNNHNKYLRVDAGATSSSNVYWVSDINSATYWEFIPEDIIFPDSGQTPEGAVFLRKHNTEYFLSLDANNNVVFSNANNATTWTLSGESNNCIIRPANNSSLTLQNSNGTPTVSSSQNTDVYGVIDSNNELTIHSSSYSNMRTITNSMLAVVNSDIKFASDDNEIFDVLSEATLSTINTISSSIHNSLNTDEYYLIKCDERYLTYDENEFFISDYINKESEIDKQLWKIVLDATGYKIVGKNILANALGISSRYNTCESTHISDQANTIYISRSLPDGKYSIINTTRKKYLTPDIHNPFWGGMVDNSWDICTLSYPDILNKSTVPPTETGEIILTNIPDKLKSQTNYIELSCPAHKASGLYNGINFKESIEGHYITEAIKRHSAKVFKDTDLSNMTDKDYTYYIYGERLGTTSGEYHPGVDVNPGEGEDVYPLYGGTVTFAGGNYGTVSIYVPELKVHMNYVHMTDIPSDFANYSTKTIKVTTDQPIGKVGKVGLESRPSGDTGPHLHFEIVSESYTNSSGQTGPSTPVYNNIEPLKTILPYWYMYNA